MPLLERWCCTRCPLLLLWLGQGRQRSGATTQKTKQTRILSQPDAPVEQRTGTASRIAWLSMVWLNIEDLQVKRHHRLQRQPTPSCARTHTTAERACAHTGGTPHTGAEPWAGHTTRRRMESFPEILSVKACNLACYMKRFLGRYTQSFSHFRSFSL